MEKTKRQKVRWEFFTFQSDPVAASRQFTLKVEQPAEIRFTCIAPVGTISTAIINNIYVLNNFGMSQDSLNATAPFELILSNNQDEIDVTSWVISIFGADTTVIVTCKYFINN